MSTTRRVLVTTIAVLVSSTVLNACGRPGPRPIQYGAADCDYCRMAIGDPRYGAELVTTRGRIHQFDSIECLAGYYRQARAAGDVQSVWVSDFTHPSTLMPADEAVFVRSTSLHSPMGRGLIALPPRSDTAGVRRAFGGAALSWREVVATAAAAIDGRQEELHASQP